MAKRAVLTTILGTVLVLASTDAAAFCRTTTCDPAVDDTCRRNDKGCVRDGVALRWPSMPIVYRFHRGGSEKVDTSRAREAIRRAFDTWSNVNCDGGRTSLRFEEGDEIRTMKAKTKTRAREPFGIYFRDDEWTHDDQEESLALTNQVFGQITGTIEYADIEINSANVEFATREGEDGLDLQAVLTHEVGHYIGLAHSPEPGSIMAARFCQSDDRCDGNIDDVRALAADDMNAVCNIYPPDRAAPETRQPVAEPIIWGGCATARRRSGDTSSATTGLLGAAVAFAVGLVRRKRGIVGTANERLASGPSGT